VQNYACIVLVFVPTKYFHIPYHGSSSRKKMFANFANLRVFANIFLLNFNFLVLLLYSLYLFQLRGERLKHSAVIALKPT